MTTATDNIKRNGGRPPGICGIRALAARHSGDCIRALAEVANNEQTPVAVRVAAAETILRIATQKSVKVNAPGDADGAA